MNTIYRPRFGRYLTIAIGALCAVALMIVATGDGATAALVTTPWLALVGGSVWAAYWRPEVAIDDGGVRLVNVLRTVDLPWPSIQRIDTKWALTLFTSYGKFTAWAAPAPSSFSTRNLTKSDLKGLPESTYHVGGSIRPGDSPRSPSGAAAFAVRRHWESLRDAGHLDDPRLEAEKAPVKWHWQVVGAGATLVLLGLIGVLTH